MGRPRAWLSDREASPVPAGAEEGRPISALLDRAVETGALEGVLAAVRDGLSGVLVLRGEAGVGKTALLDWAAGQAGDMQVARIAGAEAEMDMGFAGLHQLLVPFLGGLEGLPAPQRQALGSAFGLVAGPPPDRFLVGMAALTVLTDASVARPVLCLVDDAQWLNRVSIEVLGFVARRLYADRVGMVFATRTRKEEERAAVLAGLAELTVGGLAEEATHELLATSAGAQVDRQVSCRIAIDTAGNPLALVELAAQLTAAELSGAEPLDWPLRFGGRLEELYRSQVRALPGGTQTLLLLAAADPTGEPALIWNAARSLGIDPEAGEAAGVERLVSWEPRVRFRHPLIRSAAYYAALAEARRGAHQALAAATDPEVDPDRRAWHLAEAAAGPDEQVAAELERSADRARGRGGLGSGAAFLERAAALTPDGDHQARRMLAAAESRLAGGEASAARTLLGLAAPRLTDVLTRARARRLEGQSLYAAGQMPEATSVLLDAAGMLQPLETRLARDTLLDAFTAAQFSAQPGAGMAEFLRAVRSVPKVADSRVTVADLLLDGFAAMGERRYQAGAALLRRAIVPLAAGQPIPDDALPHLMAVAQAAGMLYDDSARYQMEKRWVAELRDRGAIAALLPALGTQLSVQVQEGRFADAEATLAEARALSEATGYRAYLGLHAQLELWALAQRGREADARPLAARLLRQFTERRNGYEVLRVHGALALLELGLGNYAAALRHALEALPRQNVLGFAQFSDVVEAGTRCGERETATAALEDFTPWALASGTDLALGLLARSRALLADDVHAEAEYRLAIDHLQRCRLVPQLARTHQVYGEWLRRQRRRRDARDQLRCAFEMFDDMGMMAFAGRARAELRATGERARPRSLGTPEVLTAQEAQIARLAAERLSNREIAGQLFISARTVEYHLHKVFRKLGVTSRAQLARTFSDHKQTPAWRD
jgi:DNA-binding CsgD family transcriptional regulator